MPRAPEFTADAWRSLRWEWLWVYRGAVPVCGVWSAEIPVPTGVFFVEQGSGRIRAEGKEFVVKRGEAFFSAPGPRQHWFAPGTRLLSVGFRCQWPDERPVFRRGLNFAAKSAALRTATLELFRCVHRGRKAVMFREAVKPSTHSLATWSARETAFLEWFSVWSAVLHQNGIEPEPRVAAKGRRGRVEQLVAWLDSRPIDQTTPSLPPGFGLGLRRADQLLQLHFGTSMRRYLEKRRLDAARKRILKDQLTMKVIAFDLGFRHASHFTAWFRRHTGMAPTAFRAGAGMAEPV